MAFLMTLLFLFLVLCCWHCGRRYEHAVLIGGIRQAILEGQQRPGRFYNIPQIGARVYPSDFGFISLNHEQE
jgi:hypothetical protein